MLNRLFYLSVSLATAAMMQGCSSHWKATYKTVEAFAFSNSDKAIQQATLDPRYRYLHVNLNKQPALLVLHSIEPTLHGNVEVWAGRDAVVLRLFDGRYFGSLGIPVNWKNVYFDALPQWDNLLNTSTPLTYKRHYEFYPTPSTTLAKRMPFSVEETIEVQRLSSMPSVASEFVRSLPLSEAAKLQWVSEKVIASSDREAEPLPAFYALTPSPHSRVVWGYQCITAAACMAWQPFSRHP